MSQDPTWSFSAQIERFDVDAAWHFLAIPAEHVDAVREAGDGRYVITGTADGSFADEPGNAVSANFRIEAAC